MAEFEPTLYTVLDKNEIDGSAKDVEIVTSGDPDDETTWTNVLVDSQELPAGDYTFWFSFMLEVHTNEEYYWRIVPETGDGPVLPFTEVKQKDNLAGTISNTVLFILGMVVHLILDFK